jgi:hypothetical protein
MATYINGVTDYIPQIQSFQPDLNFYGNVMQTRQGRFDAANKKVNDLYGSLLYSPLSRDTNIKRRDEFFKVIDNDIKRISGLDLSLKQNEDQALAVFKGFYDDKYVIADMVKTKNAQAQLQRGENFKYCTDKEKCGGQYWDQGIKKLQYKMEEFKNASDDESLNFQIGEYDPYFDWKKEATTKVKELGYDVKMETPNGKWVIKDSNGKLVEGGLYNLFTSLYGDDPRVSQNYKTEAYVARKDYGASYKDTFGSEQEAEKEYVMKVINQGMRDTKDQFSEISSKYDQMSVKGMKLQKKLDNKTITAREREDLKLINEQKPVLELSKKTLETRLDEIQNNIDANDFKGLQSRADLSAATTYQKRDLEGLAKSLGQIKQSRTIEVNPYTKMYEEFGLQKSLASFKAGLESKLLSQKGAQDKDLELLKQGKVAGEIDPVTGYAMEGLPGTNAVENIKDNPALLYNANRDESTARFQKAMGASAGTLYKLFTAAKTANNQNSGQNPGAVAFLGQFGNNEAINKITDIQSFQKLIADKKLGTIALFDKFVKDSKAPGFDNGWAKSITDDPVKYGAVINEVTMANQAFNKLTEKNWKLNKSIVDKLAAKEGSGNLSAFYAKDLLTKDGALDSKSGFITKAIKTALNNNIIMGTRDAEKMYDALMPQFHDIYNSADNISLMQGAGLPGGGVKSATAMNYVLDLAQKGQSKTTGNIVELTNTAIADFAGSKVVIGDLSKESLLKSDAPGVKEFVKWYLNEYKNPKSATGRYLNTVVANVAGDTPDVSGINFKGFDPGAVKEWEGSKDRKGPLFDAKVLENGVTLFFNNKRVPNPFNKPMSDTEVVLKSTGVASDTGFDGSAGIINYSLDGNVVTAVWEGDIYDNGKWTTGTETFTEDISKLDNLRTKLTNKQIGLAQGNKERENYYIKHYQSR